VSDESRGDGYGTDHDQREQGELREELIQSFDGLTMALDDHGISGAGSSVIDIRDVILQALGLDPVKDYRSEPLCSVCSLPCSSIQKQPGGRLVCLGCLTDTIDAEDEGGSR